MTSIFPCTCKSGFQDQHYGPGNRVFNLAKKSGVWRCTVCGKTRTAGAKPMTAEAIGTVKPAKKQKQDRDKKSRETYRR